MGRHDFRPLQVHKAAARLIETGKIDRSSTPPWYDVVNRIPPAEPLIRPQPIPHQRRHGKLKSKKPSRLYQPLSMKYEEDVLRQEFFRDHPWELARPRMIIENDGKDSYRDDWSSIRTPGQSFGGESVVQRQLWLRQRDPKMSKAEAYDLARKEFYEHRLLEDTERRVAKEEALYTGAQFGPSAMEVGMKLEDEEFERWKSWAVKEAEVAKQRQAALYSGTGTGAGGVTQSEKTAEEDIVALNRLSNSSEAAPGQIDSNSTI